VYQVPVIKAIQVTGATCKAAGLYQRLSAATELKMPLAGPPSKATMLEAAIDARPEWCDRDTTHKSMTRCARKNLTQAHLSRLTGQVEKRYYDGRYFAGYKAATLAIQSASGAGEKKYGTGLWATVNRIYKEMLNSPHHKKAHKEHYLQCYCTGGLWCITIKDLPTRVDPPQAILGACWGTEELGWNERSRKKLRDVR